MAEKNTNEDKEQSSNPQIAMQDLMDLVGGCENAMSKVAELSHSIYNAMVCMDKKLEDIKSEVEDIMLTMDQLASDVNSIESTTDSMASKLDSLNDDVDNIKTDLDDIDSSVKDISTDMDTSTTDWNSDLDDDDNSFLETEDNITSLLDDDTEEGSAEWDEQQKDKTCQMCAGTGFMGAAEGEDDETGCDEVTCPFCGGAGIE